MPVGQAVTATIFIGVLLGQFPEAGGFSVSRLTTLMVVAVTTQPATIARTNTRRLSTTGSTMGPPCGAWSPTPPSIATVAATIEPNMIDGITRTGSAAANGMAPSVMPTRPI